MQIPDGRLTFEITKGGEKVGEWVGDTVELKLICEELEEKHKVQVGEKPTLDFLKELQSRFVESGLSDCTITTAQHVWKVVTTQFAIQHHEIEDQIAALVE